jgi:hypothetical protein
MGKLALLKLFHSVAVLAAPSNLLMPISLAVEPNSGVLTDLRDFQPMRLPKTPFNPLRRLGSLTGMESDGSIFLLI